MPSGALQRISSALQSLAGVNPDPAHAKSLFLFAQLAFAGLILLLIYLASRGKKESGFRVREADRKKPGLRRPGAADPLASARMAQARRPDSKAPLLLSGIRIGGEPHEILGVRPDAGVAEIQSAYRELMKRYHPDIVGRPGSREWSDAQKIAEALNRARSQMLEALKARETHSQSPNRSGR